MIDAEERAARQRDFYLKLSPQGGHTIAAALGGFTLPGEDSQEAELRDSFTLWLQMHHSGAFPVVSETAWWMTKFMDRFGRLSRHDAQERSDQLTSYAVATIGLLLDKGVLQFKEKPDIPKIVTSTFDPGNAPIEQAILDRLEASLRDKDSNDE